MPSKKGQEQALTWLKSKTHDPNTLDAINAELCINVIMSLQRQCDQLGAKFGPIVSHKKLIDEIAMRERQISFL